MREITDNLRRIYKKVNFLDIKPRGNTTMAKVYVVILLALTAQLVTSTIATTKIYDHGVKLPVQRPLVVAHRGSSGTHPEHTVEAYTKSIEEGADIIECDLSITKDYQLICVHDSTLNDTTDINDQPEFASRLKTMANDKGVVVTDWFNFDFTLAELKQLRVRQRFSFRDQSMNGKYQICSLEEYINVANSASRDIGLYIETKGPDWLNEIFIENTTFERLVVDILNANGYLAKDEPCFLQSFSDTSLTRMKEITNLPLVYLVSEWEAKEETYQAIKNILYGVGVNKKNIVQVGSDNHIESTTDLIKQIHDDGLRIHAYTFRNEQQYLAFDFRQDPVDEIEVFFELELDGYFTDFPHTLDRYMRSVYDNASSGSCKIVGSYLFVLLMVSVFYVIC